MHPRMKHVKYCSMPVQKRRFERLLFALEHQGIKKSVFSRQHFCMVMLWFYNGNVKFVEVIDTIKLIVQRINFFEKKMFNIISGVFGNRKAGQMLW